MSENRPRRSSKSEKDKEAVQRRRKERRRRRRDQGLADPADPTDWDDEEVIAHISTMPIQGKLQFLADLYFRLKEQNEVLQRKFENEHDLFEEWKAGVSKQDLGEQVLEVKQENAELQQRNQALLDTITTLNSRTVMCISCMKKMDNFGVTGGRGESGKTASGSAPSGTAASQAAGSPDAVLAASDAVEQDSQTDDKGRKWVTVSIGEPFDRQVRRQLQEEILKRQALQQRARSQSTSFGAKGGSKGKRSAVPEVNNLNLSPRGRSGESSGDARQSGPTGLSGPLGPVGLDENNFNDAAAKRVVVSEAPPTVLVPPPTAQASTGATRTHRSGSRNRRDK